MAKTAQLPFPIEYVTAVVEIADLTACEALITSMTIQYSHNVRSNTNKMVTWSGKRDIIYK